MKKILIFIIILLPINSFSSEKIINSLKNGKKVVFIRHAIAPGSGDPENFDILDQIKFYLIKFYLVSGVDVKILV